MRLGVEEWERWTTGAVFCCEFAMITNDSQITGAIGESLAATAG